MSDVEPSLDSLRAEYELAHAGVLHYDSFRWSAGSMLIAGVFLFWGVVFTNDSSENLFAPASVVVALIMTIWLLYANHYRQLYLFKLHRIQEVEALLGVWANRRFVEGPIYRPVGIRGHNLDVALYILVSCSGAVFGFIRQGIQIWQALPFLVMAVAVTIVVRQEASIQRLLRVLRSRTDPADSER